VVGLITMRPNDSALRVDFINASHFRAGKWEDRIFRKLS
jgi:hypothetical protein